MFLFFFFFKVHWSSLNIKHYHNLNLEKRNLFTPVLLTAVVSGLRSTFYSTVGVRLNTGAKHHVIVYPMLIYHISP